MTTIIADKQLNLAHKVTQFALRRPVTIFVLFLSLLVVGTIATSRLEQELIPSGMSEGAIQIRYTWRDAPANEVLENVALPVEEELSTIKGIQRLYTRVWTGGVRINISLKQGIDEDIAYREVRDRLERARVRFPSDVGAPRISKTDASGIPIVILSIVVDDGLHDYVDLVERQVAQPLERIDGVASVGISGVSSKEIVIEIDRQALEAAGLNPLRVSRALSDDNFTLSSGHTYDGGRKYFLRSVAKFGDLEEIENRIIGRNVRLKDVAQVSYKESEKRWDFAVNSKRALSLKIIKEGSANTVQVSKDVDALVERLKRKPELQHLKIVNIFSQGDQITFAVSNLIDSGKYGAILAFIVLFFFLFRARLTLIITLSIPISLFVALTAMYFLGQTLNIFSLIALVICVGLLVDNAVVVAENVYRHYYEEQASKKDACIRGAGEIALAVLTSTLTTIIVFLPVSLVEGRAQYLLQQISVPITFSLVGSFLVALIFVPLCVYLTLSRKHSNNIFFRNYDRITLVLENIHNKIFDPICSIYVSVLGFFLKHRLDLFIVFVVLQILVMGFAKDRINIELGMHQRDNQLMIRFRAPKGTDYVDIKRYFDDIEKTIEAEKDELKIRDYMVVSSRRGGRVEAWFAKEDIEDIDVQKISAELVKRIPEKAGYQIRYGQEIETDERTKKSKHRVMLQGESPEVLEDVALDLTRKILAIDGVIGLQGNDDESPNQLALQIDREKIASAGVESNDVASVIGGALRGRQLNSMSYEGREVDMRVRFQEEDRSFLSDISTFSVETASGETLPIGAVTTPEFIKSPLGISRRNKKVTHSLNFELDPDKAREAKRLIGALQVATDLPEGVSFNRQIGLDDDEDLKQMKFALVLSVIFIYLLMGFLFESFIMPLSILLTIPLAFVGVALGHTMTNIPIDMLSLVALVLLVGVVVNNGIVLVDAIQQLRANAYTRHDALITAVKRRFRPVTMTALTTIVGLIPLTFSPAGSLDIDFKSFGTTLISGLSLATVLTLLVIPVFYSIFDDIKHGALNYIYRLGYKRTTDER